MWVRQTTHACVAGHEDTAAVCQVVDLVPAGDSTIVHLKRLPGLVENYQALLRNGGPWRQKDIDDIKVLRGLAAEAGPRP
jgi:hypothetical protein